MRRAGNLTFSLAAVSLLLSSTAISASPPPKDCTAELAKAQTDILDFYPVTARSAGAAGSATISCQGDLHDSGKDCVLVSETPAGQGFGKAALDIAAAATRDPAKGAQTGFRYPPYSLTVEFKPSPLSITPNLLALSIKGRPFWAAAPSESDLVTAMKSSGLTSLNAEADATVQCHVENDGHLAGCTVTSKFPADMRVERAALTMSRYFKMATVTNTGCAPDGSVISIPIKFHAMR